MRQVVPHATPSIQPAIKGNTGARISLNAIRAAATIRAPMKTAGNLRLFARPPVSATARIDRSTDTLCARPKSARTSKKVRNRSVPQYATHHQPNLVYKPTYAYIAPSAQYMTFIYFRPANHSGSGKSLPTAAPTISHMHCVLHNVQLVPPSHNHYCTRHESP